ncbi:MAG: EscN/YscN/HrcN family type III secretion system ATPase, partial [Mesorhizobium sp.]
MTSPAIEIESRLASIVPNLRSGLRDDASRPRKGRVRRATGTVIHATVEEVRIGEICELVDPRTGTATKAEVVGLMDDMVILVPLGDLTGLSSLTEVIATGKTQTVSVGPGLLGRVINAFGEPL